MSYYANDHDSRFAAIVTETAAENPLRLSMELKSHKDDTTHTVFSINSSASALASSSPVGTLAPAVTSSPTNNILAVHPIPPAHSTHPTHATVHPAGKSRHLENQHKSHIPLCGFPVKAELHPHITFWRTLGEVAILVTVFAVSLQYFLRQFTGIGKISS